MFVHFDLGGLQRDAERQTGTERLSDHHRTPLHFAKSRYSVRFVRDGYIRFCYAVDAEEMLVLNYVERSGHGCLDLRLSRVDIRGYDGLIFEIDGEPAGSLADGLRIPVRKANKHLRFGMDLSVPKWLLGKMCDILYLAAPAVLRGSTRRSQGMLYSMSPSSCVPCCRISVHHPGKIAHGCSCWKYQAAGMFTNRLRFVQRSCSGCREPASVSRYVPCRFFMSQLLGASTAHFLSERPCSWSTPLPFRCLAVPGASAARLVAATSAPVQTGDWRLKW